jgi:transcriptional regulator of acetoin/glycerol metabolism
MPHCHAWVFLLGSDHFTGDALNRIPLARTVQISRAKTLFLRSGAVPEGMVPEGILHSWQRSLEHGVSVNSAFRDLPVLSEAEVNQLRDRNRTLLGSSLSVMNNLYEQIMHSSSVVLLTDAHGTVLHSLGDPDFTCKTSKVSLRAGGLWSEAIRGTNAIGTALVEQAPVVVHSSDHFAILHHFLSCSASPLFDPYGSALGVLDVSGDARFYQQHTMALIRISAQQIENQLFSVGFEHELLVHFHPQPEFVGTLYEGIVVFDWDGSLLAANRSALGFLGLDRPSFRSATFAGLFETALNVLIEKAEQAPLGVHRLRTRGGTEVYCRVKSAPFQAVRRMHFPKHDSLRPAPPPSPAPLGLGDLELGDPAMQKVIARVCQVIGHDIPVLIQGESGTGKELLAKAMHHAGPRRDGPFMALNCAALPENLIESELFGYQEGAFTGARRKGSLGMIRQSHGGTLFLDEIGDMPLALQARLLRVLQERTVTPLGDPRAYPVDFSLVCATHRKIQDEIAGHRFREDLYYRLNGLAVTLPALKDRKDLLALAARIIACMLEPGRHVRMSPQVVEILQASPWPGNLRQMHNVLRTAVVLLGEGEEITLDHLAEDFLAQCELPRVAPAAAAASDPSLLSELETQAIRRTVADCGGNLSAAARRLGICRNTLYRKLGPGGGH